MTNKEMIAVVEIGSATITGAVGFKRPDGVVEVVACASESSKDCIRNGQVRNIEQTAQRLTNIINILESEIAGATISRVYVGIGGYTFHSVSNQVCRTFDEETRVTAEMIESMIEENLEGTDGERAVIDVVPQEYKVDGIVTAEPVGCNCKDIVGEYLNLQSRFSMMDNVRAAFESAKTEIADSLVTPMRLADTLLAPTEVSLGCALVDIGAGTTTVSIYKNGRLRFLSVVPLGDRMVTADLMALGIGEEEAERIKCSIGLAAGHEDNEIYTTEGGDGVSYKNIRFAIRARIYEIMANVANQIKVAGYDDGKLNSGFVFTGGALAIPGVEDYIRTQPDCGKMRVAKSRIDVEWNAIVKPIETKQIVLATLIAAGEESCVTVAEPEPVPEVDYFNNPSLTSGSLFNEDGESAQIDRDRKEAEKKAQEKAARIKAAEEQKVKDEKKIDKRKRIRLFDKLKEMSGKMIDQLNDE